MSLLTPPEPARWLAPVDRGVWRQLRAAQDRARDRGQVFPARLLGAALLGEDAAVDVCAVLYDADALADRPPQDHAVRTVLARHFRPGTLSQGPSAPDPGAGAVWMVGWRPEWISGALRDLVADGVAVAVCAPESPSRPVSVPTLLSGGDNRQREAAVMRAVLDALRADGGVLAVYRWSGLGGTALDAAAVLEDARAHGYRVHIGGGAV